MGTKPPKFVEVRAVSFGARGCRDLIDAFLHQSGDFAIEVVLGSPVYDPKAKVFLITIGETTTALAPGDMRWLADVLIRAPDELPVPLANDVRRFGRLLLDAANDLSPGAHGAH